MQQRHSQRLLSMLLLLCLLWAGVWQAAQAANDVPTSIIPVDNLAYGLLSGEVRDIVIREGGIEGTLVVHNPSELWLTVDAVQYGGATVTQADLFTPLGLLPPGGYVMYRGSFNKVDSHQLVAVSATYGLQAWYLNTLRSILLIVPGGDTVKPMKYLEVLDKLEMIPDLQTVGRELSAIRPGEWGEISGRLARAGEALNELITSEDQLEVLAEVFTSLGVDMSGTALKEAFVVLGVLDLLEQTLHTVMYFENVPDGSSPIMVFAPSQHAPDTGALRGRVTIAGSDAPAAGATVTVTGNGIERTTTTNGSGEYTFPNIPSGPVQITALKIGDGNGSAQITVVNGNETVVPTIQLSNLSLALIIDSSGSMKDNDATGLRKAASKLFVRALRPSDQIAVIDFDDRARSLWALQPIGLSYEQIQMAIDHGIDAYGGTNISGALREAYTRLDNGDNRQKIAVLLTDGQQDGQPYDDRWQQAFKDRGWPVFTFGLSADADVNRLQEIATVTGGAYQTLADAGQLLPFYNGLRVQLSGADLLVNNQTTLQQGATTETTVTIPPFTRFATFVVSWPGSRVDTVLKKPDGTEITSSTLPWRATYTKEATFEIYQIESPPPGSWQITSYGAELDAGGELVSTQVDVLLARRHTFLPLTVADQVQGPIPTRIVVPTRTPAPTVSPTITPSPTSDTTVTTTPTSSVTPSPTLTPSATPTAVPDPLTFVAKLDGFYANAIEAQGDLLYVAAQTGGLQIIDITNPAAPRIVGSYDTPGSAYDVRVVGDRAYVADDDAGLQIIDISNPASPESVGTLDTPGQAYGVAINGNLALIADTSAGLQIIDVANPKSPTLIGQHATEPAFAFAVAASPGRVYLANGGAGLERVDISQPALPTSAGSYDTPGLAFAVTLSEDYAYVADNSSGVRVINIAGDTLTEAGSYNTAGAAGAVAVSGSMLYVADGAAGLHMLDATELQNIRLVASFDTDSYAKDIAVQNDVVAVADGSGGVVILRANR